MRKVIVLFTIISLILFSSTALAVPCGTGTGPYCLYTGCWYNYTQDFNSGCWSFSSGIVQGDTNNRMYCTNDPSYNFRGFSQQATWAFTVPNDGYCCSTWELSFDFELVDPHASWWNQMVVSAQVYTPGVGYHTTTIFARNGTQGNYTSCSMPWGTFTANTGDTITLIFQGSWSGDSDSYVKVQHPRLLRY